MRYCVLTSRSDHAAGDLSASAGVNGDGNGNECVRNPFTTHARTTQIPIAEAIHESDRAHMDTDGPSSVRNCVSVPNKAHTYRFRAFRAALQARTSNTQ